MQKLASLLLGLGMAVSASAQNEVCMSYNEAGHRQSRLACCIACLTGELPVEDRQAAAPADSVATVRLAPNPTAGAFTLSADDLPPEAQVSIFDAAGKQVLQSRLGDGHFDLSTHPADLYFVRLTYAGQKRVVRVEKVER